LRRSASGSGEFVVPNATQTRQWWVEQWGLQAKHYVFSPDGRHIIYTGIRASDKQNAVFVDGKALLVATAGIAPSFPTWTPDSKHVYWTSLEKSAERPQPFSRVFLDGKATTARIFDTVQPATYGIRQVGGNGALQLLVFEGPMTKRYRITPGADSNIDSVLAAAK
jgi:WD40-like Beta Propeller Repeat